MRAVDLIYLLFSVLVSLYMVWVAGEVDAVETDVEATDGSSRRR